MKLHVYIKSKNNKKIYRARLEAPNDPDNVLEAFVEDLSIKYSDINLEKRRDINELWANNERPFTMSMNINMDEIEKDSFNILEYHKLKNDKLNTEDFFSKDNCNEKIIGLSVEKGNIRYYFYIAPIKTIKRKNVLNFGAKTSSIISINQGIDIPQDITAQFYLDTQVLNVYNPTKFIEMFNLTSKIQSEAKKMIKKIQNHSLRIEKFIIDFDNEQEIINYLSQRQTLLRKLAKMNNFDFEKISLSKLLELTKRYEEYQLKKGNKNYIKQIYIDNSKNIIQINKDNIKNFIDICSDSMYERLLSELTGVD